MLMGSRNTPVHSPQRHFFDTPDSAYSDAHADSDTDTELDTAECYRPRVGVLAQTGCFGFFDVCPPNEGPALLLTSSGSSGTFHGCSDSYSPSPPSSPRQLRGVCGGKPPPQQPSPQPQKEKNHSPQGKAQRRLALKVACPRAHGYDDDDDEEEDENAEDSSTSSPTTEEPCTCAKGFFDVMDCNTGALTFVPPQNAKTMAIMGSIGLMSMPEHARSDYPIREFTLLGSEEHMLYITRKSTRDGMLSFNRTKNRYTNVMPYDDTRVRLATLTGRPGDDYINANWVCGIGDDESPCEHAYIATQGPLEATVDDFWRMVWETGAEFIVMLSREYEKGVLKVDRYWPSADAAHAVEHVPWEADDAGADDARSFFGMPSSFGRSKAPKWCGVLTGTTMVVHALGEQALSEWGIVKRTFRVAPRGEDNGPESGRIVTQYQYGQWPDHGAPLSSLPIRKLINDLRAEQMRSRQTQRPAPIIVHCSAGIGRTGAFCTIHTHIGRIHRYARMQQQQQQNTKDTDALTPPLPATQTLSSGALLRSSLTSTGQLASNSSRSRSHSTSEPGGCLTQSASAVPACGHAPLTFNLFETVLALRGCRMGMVQQVEQYIFCYKAIIDEAREVGLLPTRTGSPRNSRPARPDRSPEHAAVAQQMAPPSSVMAMRANPLGGRAMLMTSFDPSFFAVSPQHNVFEMVSDAEFHSVLQPEGVPTPLRSPGKDKTNTTRTEQKQPQPSPLRQGCQQHSLLCTKDRQQREEEDEEVAEMVERGEAMVRPGRLRCADNQEEEPANTLSHRNTQQEQAQQQRRKGPSMLSVSCTFDFLPDGIIVPHDEDKTPPPQSDDDADSTAAPGGKKRSALEVSGVFGPPL